MKRSIFTLFAFLLAGTILCLALEISSRIYLATKGVYSQTHLYQVYDKVYPKLLDVCSQYRTSLESEGGELHLDQFRAGGAFPHTRSRHLHPYLAFIERPGRNEVAPAVNNYNSSVRKRDPNVFRVGIFGGSVARHFSSYVISTGKLSAELKKRIPQLIHKKIEVLNFASSGYRQPQQYIAASLYGDDLQMTINLDGFNELTLDGGLGYPLIFPHYSRLFLEQDLDQQVYLYVYRHLAFFRDRITQRPLFDSCGFLRSALYFLTLNSFDTIIAQRIRSFHEKSKHTPPLNSPYVDEHSFPEEERAKVWRDFTLKQHRLLKNQNIRAYFFLQPNLYVRNSKPLHPAELAMTDKDEVHGRFEDSSNKYLLLSKASENLKKEGVKLYSLVHVFKDVQEPIYIDDCCHVNERGNELILQAIVHKIQTTF